MLNAVVHWVGIGAQIGKASACLARSFGGNAFPERMGLFVDETHQPSGIASLSREHDQLLTLTPGQERVAH